MLPTLNLDLEFVHSFSASSGAHTVHIHTYTYHDGKIPPAAASRRAVANNRAAADLVVVTKGGGKEGKASLNQENYVQ